MKINVAVIKMRTIPIVVTNMSLTHVQKRHYELKDNEIALQM